MAYSGGRYNGSGKGGYGNTWRHEDKTTIMLGNLPKSNKFTAGKLLRLLEDKGFKGKFDFFYMPIDFQTYRHMGYAFVNFRDEKGADQCQEFFEGFSEWPSDFGVDYRKPCKTGYGHVQGREANVRRFQKSAVPGMEMEEDFKPMLFDETGKRIPLEDALWNESKEANEGSEKAAEESPEGNSWDRWQADKLKPRWGANEDGAWSRRRGDWSNGGDSRPGDAWQQPGRQDDAWRGWNWSEGGGGGGAAVGSTGQARGNANANAASWWPAGWQEEGSEEGRWENREDGEEEKAWTGPRAPHESGKDDWQEKAVEERLEENGEAGDVRIESKALDATLGSAHPRSAEEPPPAEVPIIVPLVYFCPTCRTGFAKWRPCLKHMTESEACRPRDHLVEEELQEACKIRREYQ